MKYPYISGPMTGIERHNFPMFFEAERRMRDVGYFPLNPAAHGMPGITFDCWEDAYLAALKNPQTWEWYIRRDLELVLRADGIVLLPGWEKSKGACLEVVASICVGNSVHHYVPPTDPRITLHLQPAREDEVYRDALKHLAACQTGNLSLPVDGSVLYS